MKTEKVNILNVHFNNFTFGEIVEAVKSRINKNEKTFIVTANPEIVIHANNDQTYASIIKKADYIIADGIGVVIGSKIQGSPLPERIAGYDLLSELLEIGNDNRWSAYFLGAKKEVVEKAVENIKIKFPHLIIAGYHDGYFNWQSPEIKDEILSKKPDLIFVALGFPKQEQWISENYADFKKGIFMGVGGSFDVIAGTVKRAPALWQKLNVEWLYRLIQQPTRWRRMLVLPLFILKVINKKILPKK